MRQLFYFNPRTRTGCDDRPVNLNLFSFHFNPRTRTGCDFQRCRNCIPSPNFNPRTRTGCDAQCPDSRCQRPISIHAPARGATHTESHRITNDIDFNPRTRTGCDYQMSGRSSNNRLFQSTHPHGVRLWRNLRARGHRRDFNPRTRTGCDIEILLKLADLQKFQSTHPHGVRRPGQAVLTGYPNFNPRTRTGCD